ncbi:histidine phosphatase family protein [Fusibacillus kribbianus]|uniref:Histidine phosphatase family protein n=1 Tax=Fusibacillus kribbianus TaxID=3044208 RepID=A0AAP4F108_9FIRM|nr:histidine phosphatase family protein [Ruminococcus sp. YH-rum2234]MDI9242863.1 histidine phosphatase family protein [Ruminococcus sp. YH-rum2234]
MRFIFVRHGETEWNVTGRYQGQTDVPLSEKGRAQAEALGKRFADIHVDEVYSSPLKRAYDTARAIAEPKGLPIHKVDGIKELNFGEWDGLTKEQLTEQFGEAFVKYRIEPFHYPMAGEGTLNRAKLRVGAALEDIKEEFRHTDKTIVVVAHGGILKLAIFYLLDISSRLYRCIELDNTSLTIIDVEEDRCILRVLNDAHHLDGSR